MNIKVFCYRTVLFMLLEIFIYFLVAVLFYTTSILVLQMILVFVAGTRLHALGILMHEGVHWHISENLKLNDLITNCLAGYWIFLPVQNYRTAHFAHHNHPFSKGDYDWQNKVKENNWHFPMSWKKFMFFLASGLFYQWRLYPYRCKTFFLDMKSQWGSRFFIIIFLLLVFYFPSYVFFLWLVPILIITPVLTRLRTIGAPPGCRSVRVFPVTG